MVYYFIYAKDISGSTNRVKFYHENGMKTLLQFKIYVERIKKELVDVGDTNETKTIFLHWENHCDEVDEDTIVKTYEEQEGRMGTEPECIVKWIRKNSDINDENDKIKLLFIITDGQIDEISSRKCLRLNENMHYETVVFHAFSENLKLIDLSVAASFLKGRCIIYRNYELLEDVDISSGFDYDQINVDNFAYEMENLKSYIKFKYISRLKVDAVALEGINKLKKLRDRLFAELSSKLHKNINLDTKTRIVFLRDFFKTEWYIGLNTPQHSIKVEIEKAISSLINYIITQNKSFSFDALTFDKKFDNPIEEEPIVDAKFTAEQEIEFPDIILDDDKGIPVILLTEFNLLKKLIFHKTQESDAVSPANFNKFQSAMQCPLFLLNDEDIRESVSYFYTLNVYKKLLEITPRTEPRTRRPFQGGLVLTDTDEFDKYNDYVLSATYFDSKKVNYNVGLFYYVLWKNAESKQWMDRNVVDHFKKYVMRRVGATRCKIGLSALPLDPPMTTSLPTALWYCVDLSSSIFKRDPLNFLHERLRKYYGVAQYMIEILNNFKYHLNLKTIRNRIDLVKHVMALKKIQSRNDKIHYLLGKIFKTTNGFLVSEIEKPFNLQKLNYLKLNHKEMLCDNVIEEKVHLNDFIHLMHFDTNKSKEGDGTFYEICENTYRPYFTIDENKSFYTELMKATRKVVINCDDDKDKINISFEPIDSLEFGKILSFYNLFINCVQDSGQYPTLPEYIQYISKKKKYIDDLVTVFPSNVHVIAEDVYARYQNFATKVDVNTFINVTKKYTRIFDRVKAEGVMNFTEDKEIKAFLSKENTKFKLLGKDCVTLRRKRREVILLWRVLQLCWRSKPSFV